MHVYRKARVVFLSVMVVAVLAFAGAAFADGEDLPFIDDGRVNAYDIAAPVAIYCSIDYPYADDVNLGVLGSVEVWALTGEDVFEKVIDVVAAEIVTADASATGTIVLDSGAGYALYLETDSSLTLAGAGYSFNWTPGENPHC